MITCSYLGDNICKLASSLINIDVPVTEQACIYCQKNNKPMQVNNVVAGISILELHNQKKPIPVTVTQLVDNKSTEGTGTELKKLISWFVWLRDVKDCNNCYNREQQMNVWGPEGCRHNLQTIVEWPRESAMKHRIPFSEPLIKILINKAIRNSEKHYEVVHSSNNSPT